MEFCIIYKGNIVNIPKGISKIPTILKNNANKNCTKVFSQFAEILIASGSSDNQKNVHEEVDNVEIWKKCPKIGQDFFNIRGATTLRSQPF